MKYINDILKQFSKEQRILVLVILLIFTSSTYVASTYLKTEGGSCSELMKENKQLVDDYCRICEILRRQTKKELVQQAPDSMARPVPDSIVTAMPTPVMSDPVELSSANEAIDSALRIAEVHARKKTN